MNEVLTLGFGVMDRPREPVARAWWESVLSRNTPVGLAWDILQPLVVQSGTGGNLTSDAHLAAMTIEHGGTLYSADNDFKRFAGLVHINPLAS